ncbi:MAG: glycosyltransferase [Dehalococcoidia bacterium]|nr:glycosyltransferase [Dehalococcoidia bacterium]
MTTEVFADVTSDGGNVIAAPAYSFIIPVYNEEDNVIPMHESLTAVVRDLNGSYEVIYVDDGSKDKSFARLLHIAEGDPAVKVVQFRRNFGQTAAISAGITHSTGEVLIFLDADLQNDPKDIPRLIEKLNEGYDVVSGWRIKRKDPFLTRRLPSQVANGIISFITGVKLHDYGCSLKAYRREVIRHVNLYGEMHRFIPVYASWVGASITELPVEHHPRRMGKSKYGLSRVFKVVLDLLTAKFLNNYSTKPIYVFGGAGLFLFIMAFITISIAVVRKFAIGVSLIQTPLLLMSAMLAMMGFQSILMGLLAEIAIRTYHESQHKPTYTIKKMVNITPPDYLSGD